jgi:hypothetical protein
MSHAITVLPPRDGGPSTPSGPAPAAAAERVGGDDSRVQTWLLNVSNGKLGGLPVKLPLRTQPTCKTLSMAKASGTLRKVAGDLCVSFVSEFVSL